MKKQLLKSTATMAMVGTSAAIVALAGGAHAAAQSTASAPADASAELISEKAAFRIWLDGFRDDAAAAGVSAEVIDATFPTITLISRVFERDDNQPEFAQSIWTYLDSAVSQRRIDDGRARFAANADLLRGVEADYGVDAATIVAIWGLESSYGAILGDNDTLSALASLAWKSRRAEFFRTQFIGALKIVQNGYASRRELRGSWAGAMGQTQFIPTTYLSYAVDRDADGRRDIWSNLGDVFASTANYLKVSRFQENGRWGAEVTLPAGFDYALADGGVTRAVAEWAAADVKTPNGSLVAAYDPNLRGRLIVPAGARGPAFIVFDNFDAILRYNRSTSYALAVGLLSDRIAGRGAP
ncbi:MAG: lytic murein transglycosylase, partial [Planctomycetota bacterium]